MSTGIVDPEDYPRYQLCKVCGAKDCDCTLADLVNKQAKEIARLESNAALISGKHASELALLIKGQDALVQDRRRLAVVTKQRDDLLAALENIQWHRKPGGSPTKYQYEVEVMANKAIATVKEKT